MDKVELKPCPFCGGNATIKNTSYHYSNNSWGDNYLIECIGCGIKSKEYATKVNRNRDGSITIIDGRQDAINFWNRRVNEDER